MRRFENTATQAGYHAAEFGEGIHANYFLTPANRDDFERGYKAWEGRTFKEEYQARLALRRHLRAQRKAGNGLPPSKPVDDW